jgi:hypothetical protein
MKIFKWMLIPTDEYNVLIKNYAEAIRRVEKMERENDSLLKDLLRYKSNEQESKFRFTIAHPDVSVFDILTLLSENAIINDFEFVKWFITRYEFKYIKNAPTKSQNLYYLNK